MQFTIAPKNNNDDVMMDAGTVDGLTGWTVTDATSSKRLGFWGLQYFQFTESDTLTPMPSAPLTNAVDDSDDDDDINEEAGPKSIPGVLDRI